MLEGSYLDEVSPKHLPQQWPAQHVRRLPCSRACHEPTQSRSTATVLAVAASFSKQASTTVVKKSRILSVKFDEASSTTKQAQEPATGSRCQTRMLLAYYRLEGQEPSAYRSNV